MVTSTPQPEIGSPDYQGRFARILLAGIVLLMLVGGVMAVLLYLIPPPPLQLAELQPAFRVSAVADLPIGGSRLINWGDEAILVVRVDAQSFAALQATAPSDGCILRWDATSMRIVSPCSYLVYDLGGNVVRGLTTVPLERYTVFVRDDVVYVARS
jgi:nitrite reductase/ring-hydroxylating ferredoxin subunit